jgi:2-oxoglutarate dehydrogenase complex dihydrolipoamide succinyltransferase (E2) component
MKHDMVMPKMGESITEGTIVKWLKKTGDIVAKDEIILEISTDKVDSEIPTPVAGKIVEILAKEGETVAVGNVIARINSETVAAATDSPKPVAAQTVPELPKAEAVIPAPAAVPETPAEKTQSSRFYSPVVLNIARSEGILPVELESITGTGISGRVTKNDILDFIEKKNIVMPVAKPVIPVHATISAAPGTHVDGIEVVPIDHIRKKIAEHMVLTVHTSPHVGIFIEVDMSNVVAIREKNKTSFQQKEGISLTFMPFISEACSRALKEYPLVNSSIVGDNIQIKHFVNLGIAVATEQGLIVPVIKHADSLNLVGFARAIQDLALRARSRKLKPDEVSGGTFSISNFGLYGTSIGFPLINQPQVAILGVGVLKKRAVVVHDAIAIRPIMYLSLTFDHRLVDGELGSLFLKRVGEHLENYEPDLRL